MNIKPQNSSSPPLPNRQLQAMVVGQLVCDAEHSYTPGAIVWERQHIVAAGGLDCLNPYQDVSIWHANDYIAMPGLINAHTHVALAYLRGLGHGKDNMIRELFFNTESRLDAELLVPLAFSYLVDGLRGGVTCFGDHYYFVASIGQACERLGVRAALAECVQDIEGPFPCRWQQSRELIENWPFSSRISPVVGPHATDTTSPKLLEEMAIYARSRTLPLHMHMAQTFAERERVEKSFGASPVAIAEKAGALSPHSLAVHLVATDKEDWRRLAANDATAGFCPGSQIIYESLAPITSILQEGVRGIIANDCAASNDHADLLAESRLFGLLARHQNHALTANAIFAMLTQNPARVFGINAGELAPGRAADFVLIHDDITLQPRHDPWTHLIYSAANRNVEHVMIDGQWVLWQRQPTLANLNDLTEEFLAAVRKIHDRVGGPHANP